MIQELDSAIEAAIPTQRGDKRKSDETAVKGSAPKKIVLNRNPSVSSETQNGGATTTAVEKEKNDGNQEKKVIKLSELSVKEVMGTTVCSRSFRIIFIFSFCSVWR